MLLQETESGSIFNLSRKVRGRSKGLYLCLHPTNGFIVYSLFFSVPIPLLRQEANILTNSSILIRISGDIPSFLEFREIFRLFLSFRNLRDFP